jgi:hypothetical protein
MGVQLDEMLDVTLAQRRRKECEGPQGEEDKLSLGNNGTSKG